MSSDAIAKLPSALKDLVAASVADSSVDSEAKPEVNGWIEKAASGQVGETGSLKVRLYCRMGVVTPNSRHWISGPRCSADTKDLYRG